jgi:hypothetical protein
VVVFFYYVVTPWNFIGSADPVGGRGGLRAGRRPGAGRIAEDRRDLDRDHGLPDLRHAALVFQGRVPVIQINERGRYLGFRDPGMDLIRGHTGLYVAREPDNISSDPFWASTTAVREPLERVERSWRGMVMDTYALEKLTGWTPELSPPPDSPLYRWRVLAGDVEMPRDGQGFVIDSLGSIITPRSRACAAGPWRDRRAPAAAKR